MRELNKTARIAGLLYLIIVACGFFYLRYVPSHLIDTDHIAATISKISNFKNVYRMGILVEIISDVVFLALSLALYKLLHHVNKTHAFVMVIFVAFSVLISFVSLQNKLAVLTLINRNEYLTLFTPGYFKAQVLLNLDLYKNGIVIGQIFWGLWLFPLGYLVFKSGFLPKILGIILIIGCFGYLANFAGSFFVAGYREMKIADYMTLPASVGELLICLGLLIMGVKPSAKNKLSEVSDFG
jgi:hypothetical protein